MIIINNPNWIYAPQLNPSPRWTSGLIDAYVDIVGGAWFQSGARGNLDNALFTVDSNYRITIPASVGGGNVTFVRGVWLPAVPFRWNGFYANISQSYTGNTTEYLNQITTCNVTFTTPSTMTIPSSGLSGAFVGARVTLSGSGSFPPEIANLTGSPPPAVYITALSGNNATISLYPNGAPLVLSGTGSGSIVASITGSVSNQYSGGVLSTVIQLKPGSIAIGTQVQVYYSYRSALTQKGMSIATYPYVNYDVYQGTAEDGDTYLMKSLSVAYIAALKAGRPDASKFLAKAVRMGQATIDAGSWQGNVMRFDLPLTIEGGEVGYYDYYGPTTPYIAQVIRRPDSIPGNALEVSTTVLPGGSSYAGFGLWPSWPVTSVTPFNSLSVDIYGDGTNRQLSITTNISATKAASGDVGALLKMIPANKNKFVTYTVPASGLWFTGNVVFDGDHIDFAYSGTYASAGSTATITDPFTDPTTGRNCAEFSWNFTNNPTSGYAGSYMGPAVNSTAGTTALNLDLYSPVAGTMSFSALDGTVATTGVTFTAPSTVTFASTGGLAVGSQVTLTGAGLPAGFSAASSFYAPGLSSVNSPNYYITSLVGNNATLSASKGGSPITFTGTGSGTALFASPVKYTKSVSVTAGWQSVSIPWNGASGFSTGSVFTHPATEFYMDAPSTTTSGSAYITNMRYDQVVSVATMSPSATVVNGVQIGFVADPNPFLVYFKNLAVNQSLLYGPASDPNRYAGIPRWTYKWMNSPGGVTGYGSWRGPAAAGYNWLLGWLYNGLYSPNGKKMSDVIVQFLYDSQQEFVTQFPGKQIGPFMPRYGMPGWEAMSIDGYVAGQYVTSTLNQWYVPNGDDWYGYTVRGILSIAEYYYHNPSSITAKTIVDNWMLWLDANILPGTGSTYWRIPASYNTDGSVSYSYNPVYNYACIAASCMFKYFVDGTTDTAGTLAYKWYRRLFDDLFANFRITTLGQLVGAYPIAEGSGYTHATVSITGDGVGAAINPIIIAGKIIRYEVTPGSGYTTLTATVSGDGTGAICSPYLSNLLNGGFSYNHTGWESSEIFNAYALLINESVSPMGTYNHPLYPTANDVTAFQGLITFYKNNRRSTRPSILNSEGLPFHEYAIDPYHNRSSIEDPMVTDTHVPGAMWTETLGPTFRMAVEWARYTGDWTWVERLFALLNEFTQLAGPYGSYDVRISALPGWFMPGQALPGQT